LYLFYSRTSAQNFSKWTSEYEKSFKEYLDSNKIDPIEGIYKTVSGKYYRLGIKKEDETHYNVIVIDSEDKKMWKQGSWGIKHPTKPFALFRNRQFSN
jgi:hypothetical protein